ncbi:MAG: DUF3082 domain-containing protein [Synechococcus sp.]
MTNPTPSPSAQSDPGFFKVVTGTAISGGMAYLFIRLLQSIVKNLPPIAVDGSPLARSISIGVRYMLVGSIGLMAFMFSMVTIGLFAYSAQLMWLSLTGHNKRASQDKKKDDIAAIVEEEKQAGEQAEREGCLEDNRSDGDAAETA